MIRMMGVGVVVACVACSSTTTNDTGPFTCRIGELTGAWRVTYAESNGTCGAIPDETAVLTTTGATPAGCTVKASQISEDKCSFTLDYTCPLVVGEGEGQWTGIIRQTGDRELRGNVSLQVTTPTATCRSTYVQTWTQL